MDTGDSRDFIIGVVLAISSCFFIGGSFIVKKISLLRLRGSSHTSASDGGFGYLRDWVWWTGFLTMGVGEAANFAAYAFAPASLVTPLGALSILVSAVLASKFLGDRLNLLGKMGCMLCILGSTMVVLHAPKEGDVRSVDELKAKIIQSGFVYYVVLVVGIALLVARFVVPRYGKQNMVIYIYICSSIGSLSVMCCKGLGLCLREAFSAQNRPLVDQTCLVFLMTLIACIAVQMNYLNKALDTFNTAIVNPVYYVFFTSCVIIASSILFEEWRSISVLDMVSDIVGLAVVIIALFLMTAFKDLSISLMDLHPHRKAKSSLLLNSDSNA